MYYVSLKQFEGPLDLLLHLITRAKVDIKDIFVSEITEQYLASMGSVDELDMDTASEFLTMAATLLEIKSRALLPRSPEPAEDGEETPEQTLIRRLEEYKLYKESAGRMKEFEQAAMQVFSKLPEEYPLPPQETELVGLTLRGLTEAFLRIWARKPASDESPETNHYAPRDIHRDEHNVQECMLTLLKGVSSRGCLRFEETFSAAPSKEEVVTLFLALLELLKLGEIHAEQEGTWGEIVLYPGRGKDVDEYGESATEETE